MALQAGVPWWRGGMLAELAALALHAGRLGEADTHARAALTLADELRDRAGRIFGIGLLATIAAERGEREHAGRLWGVVHGEEAVAPLGGWRRHREACAEWIRAVAGADFDRGYAVGRSLSIDDGVALAMKGPDS